MENLKYKKIKDAEYMHQWVFFVHDLLESLGWVSKKMAISSMEMENKETGLTFKMFGFENNCRFISLTKHFETQEIGHTVSISNETETQGLLNIFEFYGPMDKAEIVKYQLLTPWQEQEFYKNIKRNN